MPPNAWIYCFNIDFDMKLENVLLSPESVFEYSDVLITDASFSCALTLENCIVEYYFCNRYLKLYLFFCNDSWADFSILTFCAWCSIVLFCFDVWCCFLLTISQASLMKSSTCCNNFADEFNFFRFQKMHLHFNATNYFNL